MITLAHRVWPRPACSPSPQLAPEAASSSPAASALLRRLSASTFWILLSYGGGQGLRLASNLILTRLLAPEAFGIMALVSMILMGLALLSDAGIATAIAQSEDGDDPEFLDTAWSLQLLRGALLWGVASLLAEPLARVFDQEVLAWAVPIAGASLLLQGLTPARVETAHRHLHLGRLTLITLSAQALGLAAIIALCLFLRSVEALVVGMVLQEGLRLALIAVFLPGRRNRFALKAAPARQILRFGGWIFVATAFWFITHQGDRAILGQSLSPGELGLYNIALFLASFPLLLGQAITQKMLIPLYREGAEPAAISRLRWRLSACLLALLAGMAWGAPALVGLLYDARYLQAGPLCVMLAVSLTPAALLLSYDQAALAQGNSRGFCVYTALRATLQTGIFLLGLSHWGVVGGIAALGLSQIAAYPALRALARRHGAADLRHDLSFAALALLLQGGAVTWHLGRLKDAVF